MKRYSIVLFVVAALMLSLSLGREGFSSLWPQSMNTPAVPVSTYAQSLRLVLAVEGAGAEGGKISVVVNGKAVATFAAGTTAVS